MVSSLSLLSQIVVNALMNAIPAIVNVLMVCMVFWLIFSILGVQLYKGKFFKCNDGDGNMQPGKDKTQCEGMNLNWETSNINFDNTASGFLALFQVVSKIHLTAL